MADTVKIPKQKKNKRNAVLFKEMTVDMKRPKIMLVMLIINLLLIPVTASFFLGITIAAFGSIDYRVLAWYFIALVFCEMTLLAFITPAITAGSISLEKERQTLDVLLTTRMTTWEIIKGKYLSDFIFLSLMVISTFPVLSIVFIYGGLSLFQMLYVGLGLIVFIAFISCWGVFFSTLTKNTVLSVILTYLFILFYMAITIAIPFVLLGVVSGINSALYYDNVNFPMITTDNFINGDFLFLTGIFNPILTIFDMVGNAIGYNFGDESFAGMSLLCESGLMGHFTEKNLLFKAYSPLSMIYMGLTSFIVLKISAGILNPVRGKERKMVKNNGTGQKN